MFFESAQERLCTYAWETIQNNKLHFINWQIFENIAEYKPRSTLLECSSLNMLLYLSFGSLKNKPRLPMFLLLTDPTYWKFFKLILKARCKIWGVGRTREDEAIIPLLSHVLHTECSVSGGIVHKPLAKILYIMAFSFFINATRNHVSTSK